MFIWIFSRIRKKKQKQNNSKCMQPTTSVIYFNNECFITIKFINKNDTCRKDMELLKKSRKASNLLWRTYNGFDNKLTLYFTTITTWIRNNDSQLQEEDDTKQRKFIILTKLKRSKILRKGRQFEAIAWLHQGYSLNELQVELN